MTKINLNEDKVIYFIRGLKKYRIDYNESLQITNINFDENIKDFKETELYELAFNTEKINITIKILERFIKYYQANKFMEQDLKELIGYLKELKGE